MSISEKKFVRHLQLQKDINGDFISMKLNPLPDEYKNPFRLNDCEYCYNPLSLDMYNDCTFFCRYCFIRNRLMSLYSAFFDDWRPDRVRPADISIVESKFHNAFSRNRKVTGETLALRQGVPIHFGVLTDNFQPAEKHFGLTLKALKIIKEYDHPLIISTKSDLILEDPYLKLVSSLNKIILQVSFSTTNKKSSKLLDGNAPDVSKRLKVLKTFRDLGIRTVMRVAPIIAPITDKELFDTIQDGIDVSDVFLLKGFFFGGNKTISNFFLENFDIDPYKYYRDSGTVPYDGGNLCYHPQAQNIFKVKAINLIEKLGKKGNMDTILSPIFSSMGHCCGGDGLKGFNPDSEKDLGKTGIFNLNNNRYWIYLLFRDGKLTKEDYKNLPTFGSTHKKLNDQYFASQFESTWCTFIKEDSDGYYLDKDDEFLKYIQNIKKKKIMLEKGEMMQDQRRFVKSV